MPSSSPHTPQTKAVLVSVTLNLFCLALAFPINGMIQYACSSFLSGFFLNQHIIIKINPRGFISHRCQPVS